MGNQSLIEEANRSIVQNGDAGAIERLFSTHYTLHHAGGAHEVGHDGVRAYQKRLHASFQEIGVEVEILVEAGDRISWMRTIHGVHHAAYIGFPATGESISWRDMVVSRVENGRIAEEWVVTDLAERLLLARKSRTRKTSRD